MARTGKADRETGDPLDAEDHESLLRDFLSEVLFIAEVDGLVFSGADDPY